MASKRRAYILQQGHPSEVLLSMEDQQLLDDLRRYLEEFRAEEGIRRVRSRLKEEMPAAPAALAALLASLACRLSDFADDASDEQAAKESLLIFRGHEEILRDYYSPGLYEYNIGNTIHTIAHLEGKESGGYRLANIERLTESKNWYWRAVRARPNQAHDWPELMVNVANVLDECSRTQEALYWYDEAIQVSPKHPMAHGNRAQSLIWLNTLTDQFSINQIGQVHRGLTTALSSGWSIPPGKRQQWENYLTQTDLLLQAHGYLDAEELYETIRQEQAKAPHTAYQKFCLSNGLVLSEHSIYCSCAHDTHDGISIPKSASPIAGSFVPRMELLLNRLKSEFALARCLLFQSYPTNARRWNTEQFESSLTDLLDSEATGMKCEMLRTSFRLCFGVLDRIAHGICDLLDLADPEESIYFQSFWKKPGGKSQKQKERWDALNRASTPSLVALYSQATDLSIKKGEWGHLKEWRDKLEHELLFLVEDDHDLGPLFHEIIGFKDPLQIPVSTFRIETLQLLRFTAAAILNFALFVRQRALLVPSSGQAPFTFGVKKRTSRVK